MRNMLKISMLRIVLPLPLLSLRPTRGALWFSLPSPFNGRAALLPREVRCGSSFLLPSMDARRFCRAGALKRANHALPSSFFSLLPTQKFFSMT